MWHWALQIGKIESDKDLPNNKTSGLPDLPGGAIHAGFHSLFSSLLPHQRPTETIRQEYHVPFEHEASSCRVPLFIMCKMWWRVSSSLPGWYISCSNGRVLRVVQLCFFHNFGFGRSPKLCILPAAAVMPHNTAALTPSDHSWFISLSWIGERQSKWQVTSMQLLARTYGDYYEGAGKTSLEYACGADNWAIAFFDNF